LSPQTVGVAAVVAANRLVRGGDFRYATRVIESTYVEVTQPSSEVQLRKSVRPFVKRRLLKVYHGRFCFRMPGIRCGPTETRWSRERGQEDMLQLGASCYGVSVGFSKKHTYAEKIEFSIGPYASVTPVWYYDESELLLYESVSVLSAYRYRRQLKSFWHPDPGSFFGNFLDPDPECGAGGLGRAGGPKGPGPTSTALRGAVAPRVVQLVEPVSFSPNSPDVHPREPEAMAAAAAQLLEDDLVAMVEPREAREDWFSPGIVGLDGDVKWLTEPIQTLQQSETLLLASAGRVARERGFLSLSEQERQVQIPILAFGRASGAVSADLRVVAHGESGSGEVWAASAVVREDGLNLPGVTGRLALTTFYGEADLSGLPPGIPGSVLGRAYNSEGEVVAELDVPFWTEEEPTNVSLREAATAGV
jgi:hypothetical protein